MQTVKNATPAGTLTTYQSTAGGLRVFDGSESYEAKLDGRDHPVNRDARSSVSLNLIDEYTLEETDKHDEKITTLSRKTISKDGRSMRVEVIDKQRGQTMTYTAQKLP
jgi:hypothetical protein